MQSSTDKTAPRNLYGTRTLRREGLGTSIKHVLLVSLRSKQMESSLANSSSMYYLRFVHPCHVGSSCTGYVENG
jgi:hypothetical protein